MRRRLMCLLVVLLAGDGVAIVIVEFLDSVLGGGVVVFVFLDLDLGVGGEL